MISTAAEGENCHLYIFGADGTPCRRLKTAFILNDRVLTVKRGPALFGDLKPD
jgi:hypothetical protein